VGILKFGVKREVKNQHIHTQ